MAGGNTVSIWTIAGRQKIACVTGEYQRRLLAFRKGEVDLMYVRGKWYIAWLPALPFYFLELLVGLIQALVFMLLTSVFLKLICDHGHDEAHEPH